MQRPKDLNSTEHSWNVGIAFDSLTQTDQFIDAFRTSVASQADWLTEGMTSSHNQKAQRVPTSILFSE